MNRTKLKNYAPQARREFIQAVTDRAAFYGLTAKNIEPITEQGDVAIIAGKAFPRAVARKRKALEDCIARQGFEQTMEAMAYTWFNRFVAIRFMELHSYLDHGYRVLSHPESKATPEILEHAEHVELPGLDKNTVIDLKLDGAKEAELYRLLLIAQCNALHASMPFLFEQIDDETELLLPDNLLHSDSLIRKLVDEIDEEDWQEVEIIGWLYQFYISEKKDQVIGKVVKSEDIPAATQLFTPNWIVKYLVQNSLGRQWLATYPNSSLRQQMEYYIEPAEQTPEVQAQLKAITPESLNPEELTLLDPACGSGHILVEAYDLFKAIYQERGYRVRDILTLILRKNLFGLEIDDRAAQLAAFALMMKARADDRRIFASGIQPNVISIQESKGLNAKALTEALNVPLANGEKSGEKGNISPADIADLINLFEHGKTFGSLIQVPPALAEELPAIGHRIRDVLAHGDLMTQPAAKVLLPFIEQTWMLSQQYDAVVANPPYLNSSVMDLRLKDYVTQRFPNTKSDLFAVFMERNCELAKPKGFLGFMTPFVWMFLKSYQWLRDYIVKTKTISSLIHPEYHAFFDSAFVPICAFTLRNHFTQESGQFFNLSSFYGAEQQPVKFKEALENRQCGWRYSLPSSEFGKLPGIPIAYWASNKTLAIFQKAISLSKIAEPRQGLATGDNDQFLRYWYEIPHDSIEFGCLSGREAQRSRKKWFPCNKGGPFRKWYGNNEFVVNWENDGRTLKDFRPKAVIRNESYYFRKGITWSTISSSSASFRLSEEGRIFESKGAVCFVKDDKHFGYLLGLLNSKVVNSLLQIFSPTLDFHEGPLGRLPVIFAADGASYQIAANVEQAISIAKEDDSIGETSYQFYMPPLLRELMKGSTIELSTNRWMHEANAKIQKVKLLEEDNSRLFIEAYGLQDELSPQVPENEITLARPDREEDTTRLISYAIGCMMGRYSLDKPGLIYAGSGNQGFDHEIHKIHEIHHETHGIHEKEKGEGLSSDSCDSWFGPDPDGIVPITDTDWFPDDAANRFVEFIGVAWPKKHLEENLRFVAESLGPNRSEELRDTIRRYLAQGFFKDHLKTYKRRPIYWLFSSGKQRAFQCLVYLHRYNEGTLSRMRTEYVIPLQGKINARIEHLTNDAQQATSTSHRKKLEKEQDALRKQQAELLAFDEKLRHYADMRISLDLDDGVKVNYGKFGDLLAEVKTVCGKNED